MIECPLPFPHHDRIMLGHGGGGELTHQLIKRLFLPRLDNPLLRVGDDAAVVPATPMTGQQTAPDSFGRGALALTTDGHIVRPLTFPGGDIGRLAVCGTVNDLATTGARPLWLTLSFLLEEGLAIPVLEQVVDSVAEAAREAGVTVAAADTKVAERGGVDGIYITSSGVGWLPPGRHPSGASARPGDAVLVTGPLGDHGIAVLEARGDLAIQTGIRSDVAPLNGLVEALFDTEVAVHTLRDPTRGGLSSALVEIAEASGVVIEIDEECIPVRKEVASACELLGLDALQVACEGRMIVIVPQAEADRALEGLRRHPLGAESVPIGRISGGPVPRVLLHTLIGGTRVVDRPSGELLPRIC